MTPTITASIILATHVITLSNLQIISAAAATTNKHISSLTELPYDENDHLSSHIIAYPASGPCSSLIEAALPTGGNLYRHIPVAVEGEAMVALFGDKLPTNDEKDASQCLAVCLDRGVDASLVSYPLPEKYYNPSDNEDHSTLASFLS